MNAQNKQAVEVFQAEEVELSTFHPAQAQKFDLTNGREVLLAIHAIQRVISDMGGIGKTRDTNSKNAAYNYKFRGIEDMYNVISPLMVHFGLVLTPYLESGRMSKITTKTGDVTYKSVVTMRYTLISIIDGSSIEVCFVGEANDSGDKSSLKAQSQAQKAFYIQTFNIPTSTYRQDLSVYGSQGSNQHNQITAEAAPVQHNQAAEPAPAQFNQGPAASLQFKNEVDEYMRQHKEVLCEVLKRRNLDIMTISHNQLSEIYEAFKQHIAKKAQARKDKEAQAAQHNQHHHHAQDLMYAQDAQYMQNSRHMH